MAIKRKRLLSLGIPLLFLIGYLLWPLPSSDFEITFDQEMIDSKKVFLGELPDSLLPDPPNIILIMVDDLSKADIDLYMDGPVHTPNINQLADEGVKFSNAYVVSPVCSPSRAAILTGRYPQRFGFEHQMQDRYLQNSLEYFGFKYFMDSYPWEPQWRTKVPDEKAMELQGLPPSEITLAEILRKQGYQTGMVGKWHLGRSKYNLPCNLGFDYQYGFYASHSLYAPEGSEGIVDQKIEEDFTDPHIWKGQRNGPHGIHRNCIPVKEDKYLTDRIKDESIQFITENKGQPFFLWASFNAPHTPLQAKEEYISGFSHIKDPVKRVYYAMIANLDDAIGEINQAVKDFGIEENTLIFFISDNGGAEYTLTTDNGPYKGGKITDFEGGVKVPFIMKWPGQIYGGKIVDFPVVSMDIFSTAIESAGARYPSDRIIDGTNLVNAIESGTGQHKYIFWQNGFSKAIRNKQFKITWNEESGQVTLYDLLADPFEKENLSSVHPDIVDELKNVHLQWSVNMPVPAWPSVIYYHFTDEDGESYYFD